MHRPNGLALSCAAPIEREDDQADSNSQNRDDLQAALRRQLQRRVGPCPLMGIGKRNVRESPLPDGFNCGKHTLLLIWRNLGACKIVLLPEWIV